MALAKKLAGILYGVGVGPGDPELMTFKAARLIKNAPVLAYPILEKNIPSMARTIAAPYIPSGKIEIQIETPMLPEKFPDPDIYDRYSANISEYLQAGKDVVVLCEGDPFFYGSFIYIFERLCEKHSVEVVAGVSSLGACASVAGLPLVSGNQRFEIIPAPIDELLLEKRINEIDGAAIIKIGRHLKKVQRVLRRLNLLNQAIYVERATLKNQYITRACDPKLDIAPYFSMILISPLRASVV